MFQGFYEETVEFLWGIRMNNDRAWYAEHKQECARYLTGPMNELAREVHDEFAVRYPQLDLNVHMSRIYRDARRNYGKGPFKDYLWFTLYDAKHERWYGIPAFWFEIGADSWSYGVGCWEDRANIMRPIPPLCWNWTEGSRSRMSFPWAESSTKSSMRTARSRNWTAGTGERTSRCPIPSPWDRRSWEKDSVRGSGRECSS